MGVTELGGGPQTDLRDGQRMRITNKNSSARNDEWTMEVFRRRDEVEQLFTVLISQYQKPRSLMKYSNRKVKTEGSSCSNSTILNWGGYCHRPWKEPSIATGGTSFPCGLSMLHWVRLFCWSFRLGTSITSHEVGGRQLCICVGGVMGDASVPQPEPSLGVPGMGALSPAADRQWDLVWSPSRAVLEPEAGARTPGSLPSGPHCSPWGVPLCLGCGAQLRHEHMHCWQPAAR